MKVEGTEKGGVVRTVVEEKGCVVEAPVVLVMVVVSTSGVVGAARVT